VLVVRNLGVTFAAARGSRARAVRDVSFAIAPGESLALVGESGSGKSATALALMRLLPPGAEVSGEIVFESRNLLDLDDNAMRLLRGQKIAMIFQEPMTALNPVMRVGDQVAEAALAHSSPDARSKREAWDRAVEALREVQIPDPEGRAHDYPHQLSGGQRQRVMIAMALVNRPQLLVADEPTTALDVTVQAQILELIAQLRSKYGLAMLFISHDLAVVSQVADRVAVMYAGQIVETGATAQIVRTPVHPYTRGLLASVPRLTTERTKPLRTIEPFTQSESPLVELAPGHWARV
jgi:peptide/nickel transport system ATP-binding protein